MDGQKTRRPISNSIDNENVYNYRYHGDEPYRILVVQNRILFVISGFYLCKRVFVGRGKYPENHM